MNKYANMNYEELMSEAYKATTNEELSTSLIATHPAIEELIFRLLSPEDTKISNEELFSLCSHSSTIVRILLTYFEKDLEHNLLLKEAMQNIKEYSSFIQLHPYKALRRICKEEHKDSALSVTIERLVEIEILETKIKLSGNFNRKVVIQEE